MIRTPEKNGKSASISEPRHITRTTLEHVASKAQVSISTVSRVLNGKKGVNEGTRRRVLSILAGSNYHSEETASLPRSNRVLGILVPAAAENWGLHSHFIQRGLEAITDIGRQSNYVVTVGAYNPQLSDRAEDRMIMDHQFSGVLLLRTCDDLEDSRPFRDRGIPYVIANRLLPGTSMHYVGVDHREVGRRATEYLIQSGYKNIGILLGDTHYVSHELYLRGYEDAHVAAGLQMDPARIGKIELSAEEGYSSTQRLMKQRTRPDALIVPSDRAAIGSLKALRDLKIGVPEDIGLLALDGTDETAFADPPLTAVEIPWYEMLALGTTLLIKMIESPALIEKVGIRFASRLVIRQSTRARKNS